MLYGDNKIVNYLLILFMMTFVLNCAEGKQENIKDKGLGVTVSEEEGEAYVNSDPAKRQPDETPEEYQLRIAGENNVKERTTINYLYDLKGNLMDEGGIAEEIEFDQKGRLIEHTVYRGLNKINYTWEFQYDKNDNLIGFKSYDRNNVLQLQKSMTYNNENKLTEAKEIYTTKGNEISYKYIYNNEGLLIETEASNTTGLESSEKREYNGQGKVEKILMLDQNGNVSAERKMEYSSKGNLTKEIITYPGRLEQVTTYGKYSGVYPKEIIATLQKKIFEYDGYGNVTVDIMYNSEGGRQHKYIIEYDDKGLITKKTRYDALDKPALVIKYEYEFYK